jgi:O-succinylbenzoate synthase
MLETGVGKAFAVHLASCPGFSMPADISETRRYFVRDVLATPITVEDGLIQVPSQPGLGWTVDEKALSALTVSSRSITPCG